MKPSSPPKSAGPHRPAPPAPPLLATLLLFATCFCFGWPSGAQEPAVRAEDLPRVPPTEPKDALKTFKIKPGFRIELAAAEPLVVDPIAMAFDENGRLFVVEMRDYSERRAERLGRIRLLEDTNGDGIFDKSSVYVDHLPWPTAVICWKGGVFVGSTPDIFYCKDLDGDGKADLQKVVFTGFGAGNEPLNVQQLFNSFSWGLDNRIHGATGGNGGRISRPDSGMNTPPVELKGRDFSFDPQTLELSAESGGGQYGMSFDNAGRKFICNNSSHIRLVMYEDRYAERNPFFAPPPPALDIALDGPAAEVYRLSPDEKWRVLRTLWRVAGKVPGPIEGGGRPSGYFTGATGITIYRGDAWPQEFAEDAFVADCGSNLIHRKKIRPKGIEREAARPTGEERVEFLASTDNWFRPVQMANGPDGNLYVADMYREIIEHPWSLPPSLKAHLDLNSGNDRGRIYRIAREDRPYSRPAPMGSASTAQLVKELASANGWRRDTAARLLYERQDPEAIPSLKILLRQGTNHFSRLHALYALLGQRSLDPALLVAAFDDRDPAVRRHAVLLSERWLTNAAEAGAVVAKLAEMVRDPDPEVRYQLAFTAGTLPPAQKVPLLAELAKASSDPFFRAAILSSAGTGAAPLEVALIRAGSGNGGGETALLTRQLAELVGTQNQPPEVALLLDSLSRAGNSPNKLSWMAAFAKGFRQGGHPSPPPFPPAQFNAALAYARPLANDRNAPIADRLSAISFLALEPGPAAAQEWLRLLSPDEPPEIARAAIAALGDLNQTRLFQEFMNHWSGFTPQVKIDLIGLLMARAERMPILLRAIEEKKIIASELAPPVIRQLRESRNSDVSESARRLFAAEAPRDKRELFERFLPALSLPADAGRGRKVYDQLCRACHQLEGQGGAVGPDLATVRRSGKEKILSNIVDPNAEVAPGYFNYVVETKDQQTLSGVIAAETSTSLILRNGVTAEVTVLRRNIESLRSEGVSGMPEGLAATLTVQAMADLLELLCPGADNR